MRAPLTAPVVMLLALLVTGFPHAPAFAQQTDGGIEGLVRDFNGQPLEGARVTATAPVAGGQASTVTNAAGVFRFVALPLGDYEVRVTHIAHRPAVLHVMVVLGATRSLGTIRLEQAVIELPAVVVTEHVSALDPTSTTGGGQLSRKLIDALPSDRNFRSLTTVVPQVNPTFSAADANIAGSSSEGNFYFIDGNDVTSVNASSDRPAMSMPLEFVRAIDVKTGGYEAEFGRAMGGLVNVVTRSGGDRFHGQLFGYYTNHDLASQPKGVAALSTADVAAYDVGGSFEGPIVREHMWFFAAYNPTVDSRTQTVDGFPDQDMSGTVHRFAGKVTWQPAARTRLEAALLGDPGSGHVARIDPGLRVLDLDAVIADTRNGTTHGSVALVQQVRGNVLLRADVARLHERASTEPISDVGLNEPHFLDYVNGTVSGGFAGTVHDYGDRTSGRASVTWLPRNHTAKLGVEYVQNAMTWDEEYGAGGVGGGGLYFIDDTTWAAQQASFEGTVRYRMPTVYTQDSWQVSERLRINGGVRWDWPRYQGTDGQTKLSVNDAFQPRIGFVLLSGERKAGKLSGSWGRYFEQLSTGYPGVYFVGASQLSISWKHDPRVDPSGGDSTVLHSIPRGVGMLPGQYFDEWTLGYEHELSAQFTARVRYGERRLGEVIEDGLVPSLGEFRVGNPGRGVLDYLPRASARYQALELVVGWSLPDRATVGVSYVLSHNQGNYEGLILGNGGPQFDFVETTVNSAGDLPNDRRHVFKINATGNPATGLSLGLTGVLESGAPLSELGGMPTTVPYGPIFLRPRGTAGRTPWLWDLNVRVGYDLPGLSSGWRPRATLDLFHVFNPCGILTRDQQHYFSTDGDGNPIDPNSNYLKPTSYQPPFSARLGLGVSF